MDELPDWEPGTVAILVAAGPHAIPVSTAVRIGERRIAFALGRRRATLERLRATPQAALIVLAPGRAFSAYGRTAIMRERLEASDRVCALELRVESLQDHLDGARTEILEGVSWRWTEDDAAATDEAIRAELARLSDP